MYTKIFLLVAAVIVATPAFAVNCIKYPKECAKDLDRRRRQLTDVVIDVGTLGHTKRERERDEADEEKKRAEMARDHARQIQEREFEEKRAKLLSLMDFQRMFERFIPLMTYVEKEVGRNIRQIKTLFEDVQLGKAKSVQIHALVMQQNADLATLLTAEEGVDKKINEQTLALIEKVHDYRRQFEEFPFTELTAEEADFLSTNLIEQNFEIMTLVKGAKSSMESDLKTTVASITKLKALLEENKRN
jgi:alpha-D-ribose 1-methylphosphonate 5-triphosphate diphosphatase PhnM